MVRHDVNAILFDEPLTVIDPHMKWELRTQLKALHREFGHTMIYVTHDQTEALTFADEVVVMSEGRVVQAGTPQSLFDKPEHTFVGYFIGSPGMNLLEAEVDGATARVAGATVPLAATYRVKPGRVQIGVRPDAARLSGGSEGVPFRLDRVEDVGHHRILRGRVGDQVFNLLQDEGVPIPEGASRVTLDPARIGVFVDDWRVEPLERAA